MKKFKLISSVLSIVSAAAILTMNVCAYDFGNKNLGKNWSLDAQVPASEFADLTADSYVTVTFETDASEDTEDQMYWSIKPMDSSWNFIDPNGVGGPELAEGKDAYPVEADATSITFKVPADVVDTIKESGMIFIGHKITLKTLTISAEAPATEPDNSQEPSGGDDNTDTPPNTGVEGAAVVIGIAAVAAAALAISKKR